MLHSFKYKENFYLLDVESGSVYACDSNTHALVQGQQLDETTAQEIQRELNQIETKTSAQLPEYKDVAVKALCLHAAHDCNLACDYCFGDKGEFHGKRELMSFEVAKQAIDYLLKNSERHNLEVDFFGGEPLMNFDVVKKTVAYAREQEKVYNKKIAFTLTTNAYHITDEMIDFIHKEIKNIVISIDGRQEVHDALRKTVGGKGSYDKVVANAKRIVQNRGDKEYYIRGTFSANNLDFTQDVSHIASLGFDSISIEPVVTQLEMGILEEHIPVIIEEYEKLSDWLDEHPNVNFFHFNIDLDSGPCVIKRIRGCGAGNEYMAVTPDGKLYPCHQFAGKPEFLLGDVFSGVQNTDIPKEFCSVNIVKKQECAQCFAKYYCSGGCAANGYTTAKDIHKNHTIGCALMKRRVEISIAKSLKEYYNKL